MSHHEQGMGFLWTLGTWALVILGFMYVLPYVFSSIRWDTVNIDKATNPEAAADAYLAGLINRW